MPARTPEGPADPFAPPGVDTEATLDLTERPSPPRPAMPAPEEPLFIPQGRKPVEYRKPGGNPVLWVALMGGLGAAGFFGWRSWQQPAAVKPMATAPVAAAPAKPVTWKPVQTGDAVLVTVELSPRAPSARLLLDGEPVSSNPVRIPKGGKHTVMAVADGFEPASAEITADSAQTVRLRLKKSR